MRLASLYSGGKDSTFSLYLAEQHGHEVPYLVNIRPSDSGSWIFHTPNLDVVPAMAAALGKKLVVGRSTGEEKSDLEGMYRALDGLDIEGIVTGAVWSDYQWDRMNLVCGDLGLKLFAPLWRKDQEMVLREMIAAGIKAIVVGCFAEGFDESWLGRPLDTAAVADLLKLRDRYGISIMGEGGEYESMTLDSPLHSHPLQIAAAEKVWKAHSGLMRVTALKSH
ncbi:MAG: diphthine--ammonia ligase [Methanomethylophilus sp.]|nr:diphthine--ammonia ligase [Methanomethylophilus sp.]MDD4221559.1 diphthine--ammonia ligase [Methanomethylophilus sp.]MDD4668541.1 diphthine--ammonia ligase [Methanomethylophilus sp.]